MALPIGELFMLGFRGAEIPAWMHDFARQYGLGGVLLFDYDCTDKKYERNVFNPAQVKELCQQIHALPSNPRVFVDQEGGKVRRLKDRYGFQPLPSAKQFGNLTHAERLAALRPSFREMKDLGIDVNLAPVIDADYNPLSPDLGAVERCFSADLQVIAECVDAILEANRDIGLGLCLKHFPGCGGAKVNSHNELMNLTDSLNEDQIQLFQKILPRLPMVLFSHGLVDTWDKGVPVSLSSVAVEKVRAWVPDALIITDDLQMEGMQRVFGTREACLRAVRAGVDILCIGNNLKDEQLQAESFAQALLHACDSDPVLRNHAQASLQRIKRSKQL